jgi:hypothetical protein
MCCCRDGPDGAMAQITDTPKKFQKYHNFGTFFEALYFMITKGDTNGKALYMRTGSARPVHDAFKMFPTLSSPVTPSRQNRAKVEGPSSPTLMNPRSPGMSQVI